MISAIAVRPGSQECTCHWPAVCDGTGWKQCQDDCDCRCGGMCECPGCLSCGLRPYYDHDGITIYHGDCREILPQLGPVDLVLTDPPYGLQALSSDGYGRRQNAVKLGQHGGYTIANDMDTKLRDWMLWFYSDIPVLIFSSPRLPEPPGNWDYRLIWDKAEGGINSGPWRYNHELIFLRGNGWRKTDGGSFSILRYRTGNGCADRELHPHKKPTELIVDLTRHAPDGTILDPFMGSGTTLVAAKRLGRHGIGIEIEERYCEIAAQRLEAERLTLFEYAGIVPTQLKLEGLA